MSTTHTIVYSCKHTVQFNSPAPRLGDDAYCYRCNKTVTVDSAPDEWRTACADCSFTSLHGQAKESANIAAGRHRMRKGKEGHRVRIFNGQRLVRTFDGAGAVPQAPSAPWFADIDAETLPLF